MVLTNEHGLVTALCITFVLLFLVLEEGLFNMNPRGRRDRMVVGFTTTYAIFAYHHLCCEFESRSGRIVQHNVIK